MRCLPERIGLVELNVIARVPDQLAKKLILIAAHKPTPVAGIDPATHGVRCRCDRL